MLQLVVAALLGTFMLAQQPTESVQSSDLPGSVSVPAKKPAAAAPVKKVSAQEEPVPAESETKSNAQAPAPTTPAPAPAAAAAPAPPPQPAPQPAAPAAGGKRVAAFWMMLPGGP